MADGYLNTCKACAKSCAIIYRKTNKTKIKSQRQKYYTHNKESMLIKNKIFRTNHPEYMIEYNKKYNFNNIEHLKQIKELWRKSPNGILSRRLEAAKRRANIAHRLPSYADLRAIKQFYANFPKGMVVDHIIPLQGKTISGFHVHQNLQYLTPEENSKKVNKFPYYPLSFYKKKGLLPLLYPFAKIFNDVGNNIVCDF